MRAALGAIIALGCLSCGVHGFSSIRTFVLNNHQLALNVRRPQPEYQEDAYDADDEVSTATTRSMSPEERELRERVKYKIESGMTAYQEEEEEEEEDYLDDDEDYIAYEEEGQVFDDDYYEDDDELAIPAAGNFWSNPSQSMDSIAANTARRSQQRKPRRDNMPPSTAIPRRRPSRGSPGSRTTFRSGIPAAPDAVKDFYDQIFWYGMDEEDGEWQPKNYDKTVFGGTRGKFNALAYLEDDYDTRPPPRRIKRRLGGGDNESFLPRDDIPRRRRKSDANWVGPEVSGWFEEGDDEEEEERFVDRLPLPRRRRPVEVSEWFAQDDTEEEVTPRRRGRPAETSGWFGEDDDDDDEQRQDASPRRRRPTTAETSGWFGEDEQQQQQQQDAPRRRRSEAWFDDDDRDMSRRRRPQRKANPIVRFLDSVFDMDRDEMKGKANVYEQTIGRQPKPVRRIQDYDVGGPSDDELDLDKLESDTDDEVIVDVEIEDHMDQKEKKESKPEMSWEERSRRLERVPPSGVPAWGPSGDLGIDARTKAMLDAMDDLRRARNKLESKTERKAMAREEIVVLRTDYELESKRSSDPRRSRTRLRSLQLDIEDGARDLRRAQKQEQVAKEHLEDLQDKYWAVLSLYDSEKASQEVTDAFAELKIAEPAVAGVVTDGTVQPHVDVGDES